jgi:hypothetical protein
MYHIWPSYGQTHLLAGQFSENQWFRSGLSRNCHESAVQLARSVSRTVGGVKQNSNTSPDQSRFDTRKTCCHASRLIGEAQSLQAAPDQQLVDKVRQIRRRHHLPLQPFGE